MSLYGQWREMLENQGTSVENQKFFENYLEKETQAYKDILATGTASLAGKVEEIAQKYDMDNVTFMGFLDGINSSFESDV